MRSTYSSSTPTGRIKNPHSEIFPEAKLTAASRIEFRESRESINILQLSSTPGGVKVESEIDTQVLQLVWISPLVTAGLFMTEFNF
jgi:hypothetical protein